MAALFMSLLGVLRSAFRTRAELALENLALHQIVERPWNDGYLLLVDYGTAQIMAPPAMSTDGNWHNFQTDNPTIAWMFNSATGSRLLSSAALCNSNQYVSFTWRAGEDDDAAKGLGADAVKDYGVLDWQR